MKPDEFNSFFSNDKLIVKKLLKKYVPYGEWTENSFGAGTQGEDEDMDFSTQAAN